MPVPYYLGQKSIKNLGGVHPDLQAIVRLAITITEVDFSVFEGVRTHERQRILVATGSSWTMDSKHIPSKSTELGPTAHAVDLVPYIDGKLVWESVEDCRTVARAMHHAAETLGLDASCGGEMWGKDWFHWEVEA